MTNQTLPRLSIVIVNWNTRDLLRQCLRSILDTLPPIPCRTIVVDNDSSDGSAEMVEGEFPEVMLIRGGGNIGFSAGNNIGFAQAAGDYILLLNPDAELMPGAVRTMIEFADAHPEVAFVGPKLLNTDGSLQKNGRKFPSFLRELLGVTRLYKLIWGYYDRKMGWGREDFDVTAEVDEVSGACILARKTAVDQVGGLDERFFMYYEEVDWCLRMRQAGWSVYYLPAAEVKHHWASGAKKTGLKGSHVFLDSQYKYFLKHHGLLQASALRLTSWLILAGLHAKHALMGGGRR